MAVKHKIAILVSGGCVQEVYSDITLDVVLLDKDNFDNRDDTEWHQVWEDMVTKNTKGLEPQYIGSYEI